MNSQLIRRFGFCTLNRYLSRRNVSILSTLKTNPVLVSSNTDVHTNLALEHWLYNNLSFNNSKTLPEDDKVFQQPVVLMWVDEPSVVFGRHQNPWLESTLGFVNKAGIKLARRHSGGGCVYHDENNINISVIGDRSNFENRQQNLKFLADVLDEKYGIKCEPNKRHDLIHCETGFKVSGSAAKLGRFNSYHHFTLLIDTDKEVLQTAIRQNPQNLISTNCTKSTRAKVINLKEIRQDLEVNQVLSDVANAYSEHYGYQKVKGDNGASSKVEGELTDYNSLSTYREELQSWEWIYGKTPAFKLKKSLKLIEAGVEKNVNFNVQINKGLFERIEIDGDPLNANSIDKFQYLIGTRFNYTEAMVNLTKLLDVNETALLSGSNAIGTQTIFATFLLQMIHEANF